MDEKAPVNKHDAFALLEKSAQKAFTLFKKFN